MHTVISVENMSKHYRLGLIGATTFRDDLNRRWARVRGQPDPLHHHPSASIGVDRRPSAVPTPTVPGFWFLVCRPNPQSAIRNPKW